MASPVLSNDELNVNTNDTHLELFSLIWLDASDREPRDEEQKLRSIINHVKKFQDVKQCEQYIEQTSEKDRLIVIVSGQLGMKIVPSIHKLRQVISIYLYCMNMDGYYKEGDYKENDDKKSHDKKGYLKKGYELWSSEFVKVK